MPKLRQDMIDVAFYLYPSEEAAAKGRDFGGTGFFAIIASETIPDWVYCYAVTNWHVAVRDGCSVIRVNTVSGGSDIIPLDPSQWLFTPQGPDLAIALVTLDQNRHRVKGVGLSAFASSETISNYQIGVGEDVVMIGRFVDHDGGIVNRPAARFGNIAVMSTPLPQATKGIHEAYCLDMHSRSGYSGSPVFVYRTTGSTIGEGSVISGDDGFLYLLGVHYGQFVEYWTLQDVDESAKSTGVPAHTDAAGKNARMVRGLSGMTCVAPAWQLRDLLFHESEVKRREQLDLRRLREIQTVTFDTNPP
ncbi:MAG: hypothetical protein JSR66_01335 [Proteobacteria bacterium]|nr:hypothetical protein [Pseudomonadota bacterium]